MLKAENKIIEVDSMGLPVNVVKDLCNFVVVKHRGANQLGPNGSICRVLPVDLQRYLPWSLSAKIWGVLRPIRQTLAANVVAVTAGSLQSAFLSMRTHLHALLLGFCK